MDGDDNIAISVSADEGRFPDVYLASGIHPVDPETEAALRKMFPELSANYTREVRYRYRIVERALESVRFVVQVATGDSCSWSTLDARNTEAEARAFLAEYMKGPRTVAQFEARFEESVLDDSSRLIEFREDFAKGDGNVE